MTKKFQMLTWTTDWSMFVWELVPREQLPELVAGITQYLAHNDPAGYVTVRYPRKANP